MKELNILTLTVIVRDQLKFGSIISEHVSSANQVTDIMAKILRVKLHQSHVDKLGTSQKPCWLTSLKGSIVKTHQL